MVIIKGEKLRLGFFINGAPINGIGAITDEIKKRGYAIAFARCRDRCSKLSYYLQMSYR